jgi:hypothetical protein
VWSAKVIVRSDWPWSRNSRECPQSLIRHQIEVCVANSMLKRANSRQENRLQEFAFGAWTETHG